VGERKSTLDPGWCWCWCLDTFILFCPHTYTLFSSLLLSNSTPRLVSASTNRRSAGGAMSDSAPTALAGRLVPLRTKDEVRASLETQVVYVVEVPAKHANVVKE
jgi:hypothetical protein